MRVLAAVGVATVSALAVWIYAPLWGRRNWCVPGFKKRVAIQEIKRMEVQAEAEGGTALIVTFGGDWSWVICRGTPAKLQELGGALGRVMGLTRLDLVTWGRGEIPQAMRPIKMGVS